MKRNSIIECGFEANDEKYILITLNRIMGKEIWEAIEVGIDTYENAITKAKEILEVNPLIYAIVICKAEGIVKRNERKSMVREDKMSENEKEDFVEIHKFCINCGKEIVGRLTTTKERYELLHEFIGARFLCRDCNPFKKDFYGNEASLLSIKEGEMVGVVFTQSMGEDANDK